MYIITLVKRLSSSVKPHSLLSILLEKVFLSQCVITFTFVSLAILNRTKDRSLTEESSIMKWLGGSMMTRELVTFYLENWQGGS